MFLRLKNIHRIKNIKNMFYRKLAPDVRTHKPTATGASLIARPGTNPVPVVCSGVPLCAWHSTGIPVWQPAADIRDRRSSMSPLYWHHDTASAVDSSSYPRRPRLSGGCSACVEQSATRDSGLLLTFDIPEGDQVSPFSSVIRLTWRRLYFDSQQTSALSCATVLNLDFCKVPP